MAPPASLDPSPFRVGVDVFHLTEAWGGGVSSAITQYLDAMNPRGQFVFAAKRDGFETTADVLGKFHSGGRFSYLIAAYKLVKKNPNSYIFLHSSFAGVLRLLFPLRTNLVYIPHCYGFERRDTSPLTRSMIFLAEWAMAKTAGQTIALSPWEEALAKQLGCQRVSLIPNFSSLKKTKPKSIGEVRRIGMVGRLSEQKDPMFFLSVAHYFKGSDVEFVWVGGGDAKFESSLRSNGVRVTGWLPREKVELEVSELDILIHVARWEGSPLTTLDAAQLGIPVISRSINSMTSLGYFAAGVTAEEVASSLLEMKSAPQRLANVHKHNELVLSQNSRELNNAGLASILEGKLC